MPQSGPVVNRGALQPGKWMDNLIEEFEERWRQGRPRAVSQEERQCNEQELVKVLFGNLE